MSGATDALVVGVDIGGTTTDAVVTDRANEVRGRARLGTDAADPRRILDGIVAAIRGAVAEARVAEAGIRAVGVGIPGQVEAETGVVRLATNLNIADGGFRVGAELEAILGVAVTVENDARAAAVAAGDLVRRDEPGLRSLAYLSIGTGISAGFLLDGEVHRGRDGLAGEIGHVVVDPAGPVCRCGQRGCLEAVAAGPAIGRLWNRNGDRPAEDLFRAAGEGDPEASAIAGAYAARLAQAIQWIAAAFAPDLVVLGGGIGSIGDPLLSAIRGRLEALTDRSVLARRMVPPDRLIALPAGFPAGAIGAATLARRRLERGGAAEGGGP